MAWTAPRTWVGGETLTAALLNTHLRDNLNAGFPVGSIHAFIQAATTSVTPINGFALEANGTLPVRATYSSLNSHLSALGYPFGNGDGSTTFTIIDLQGRSMVAMASGGHTDVNGLGDSDGLAKASRTPIHNSTHSLTTHIGGTTVVTTATGRADIPAGAGINVGASSETSPFATSGTIGPGGSRPDNTGPFVVFGVFAVKY